MLNFRLFRALRLSVLCFVLSVAVLPVCNTAANAAELSAAKGYRHAVNLASYEEPIESERLLRHALPFDLVLTVYNRYFFKTLSPGITDLLNGSGYDAILMA